MRKFLLNTCLFLLLFIATERFCHKQTGGFQLHKILSLQGMGSAPAPSEEIRAVFSQPFYFLGHGGQCYAFESEDGQTVLKFFKQHHIRFWKFLHRLVLPSFLRPYQDKLLSKTRHQSSSLIESCQISYSEFKEQTGLLYLHLHQTQGLPSSLTIVDKLGIAHQIDLNTVDFALQKKAELVRPKLKKLIKENDLTAAKQCLFSLLTLIAERSQKGIIDRDPNIRRNMGFVGTQAIEIDLGSYSRGEPAALQNMKDELLFKTKKLKQWLDRKSPELSEYLVEAIDQM
jgi:hypothetical protein